MPDPTPTDGPDFSKVGFGAMGNVEVNHDESRNTMNHVTHDSSTTVHTHHDDKSQHIDQSITKQTTIHQTGLSPMVLFATTCVIIAGFLFVILALKPTSVRSGNGEKQVVTSPLVVIDNKTSMGHTPPVTAVSGLPQIVLAEVGVVVGGQFTPRTTFKSGELLTLHLIVSRDCHVRVIYQPAHGDPMWMHPEAPGASDAVSGGTEYYLPDPNKLATRAADATAFQLYHDTGTGPPIREQILVQIAEEPFTAEGAVRSADAPYRTYQGLTLAEARMRGVLRLKGLSASAVQAQKEALLSERMLPFTITP